MATTLMVTDASKITRRDFPKDFIFGVATSAYQIEGATRQGGRGASIWDTFTHQHPDKVTWGGNGDMGSNSYHFYKEDVAILKQLGLDAYRFSISWPRVLPGGRLSAGVNKEGIDYYNNLINELIANGIEPYVTLFHWDLPQALEDEYGGFLHSKIQEDFCEYAELCFWEFGDRVKHWITMNEPWTYSVYGYARGDFPPCRGYQIEPKPGLESHVLRRANVRKVTDHPTLSDSKPVGDPGTEPYTVTHNLILAHAKAVQLYRSDFKEAQGGKIGMALLSTWMEPMDKKCKEDIEAKYRGLDFMLGWYLEPLTSGDYPHRMKILVKERLPQFSKEEREMVKGSHDFLGINYYTANYVTPGPPGIPHYDIDQEVRYFYKDKNGNDIGPSYGSQWCYQYPEGLKQLLLHIKNQYKSRIPIYITENGMHKDNDPTKTVSETRIDDFRKECIQNHLSKIHEARNCGVDVKAYFVWSLMDNFEWTDGYHTRFGIVHVDYNKNFARYPKKSALWYQNHFHKNIHKHCPFPLIFGSNKEDNVEEDEEEAVPTKRARK